MEDLQSSQTDSTEINTEKDTAFDAIIEVSKLYSKISSLEQKIAEIENNTKVERTVTQLVFDREGTHFKVRAKILIQSSQKSEETWQDVTENYTQDEVKELFNGA